MNHQLNSLEPIVWMPTSVEEAMELKSQLGTDSEFVSGATLLQLQWMNGRKMAQHFISIEQIASLKEVTLQQDVLSIGALTTLGSYQKDPILKTISIFCDALKSVAAPALRNRGTIGGNIMGGVGDLIPFFLALEAKLTLHESDYSKSVDFWEWLQQKQNNGTELLSMINIPFDANDENCGMFYRKIGRRETFTAAILTVSGKIKWDDKGVVTLANLAVGGGDNKPSRLVKTEQLLIGKRSEDINWKSIFTSISNEFNATEDGFVSSDYRKKVAANLIIAELQNKLGGHGEVHVYEI